MQGEALLFARTMSMLTFLCPCILNTKCSKKNKKSHRHAIVATGMSRPIQTLIHFPPTSNNLFRNHALQSNCGFDEDIFKWLTSLSLTCYLSHTRGISLFSDDDDILTVLSKVLMILTRGGVKQNVSFTN